MLLQKVVEGVFKRLMIWEFYFFLVRQGDWLQLFASIEEVVGERCYIRMHTTLTTQDGCKRLTTSLALLMQQAFEERQTTSV